MALTRQVIFRCWRRRHRVTPPTSPPTSPPVTRCHLGVHPHRHPPAGSFQGRHRNRGNTILPKSPPQRTQIWVTQMCPPALPRGAEEASGVRSGGRHERDSGGSGVQGSPPNMTEPPPRACAAAMGKLRHGQGDPGLQSPEGEGGTTRGAGGVPWRGWFWGGSRGVSPEGDPERVCGISVVPLGAGGEVLCELCGGSQAGRDEGGGPESVWGRLCGGFGVRCAAGGCGVGVSRYRCLRITGCWGLGCRGCRYLGLLGVDSGVWGRIDFGVPGFGIPVFQCREAGGTWGPRFGGAEVSGCQSSGVQTLGSGGSEVLEFRSL